MSKYKAVFFDLDGTLADTDLMIVTTMLEIYQKHQPRHIPTLSELISFSGPALSDAMARNFEGLDIKMLVDEFRIISPKNYDKYVVLFPGVIKMLAELKAMGLTLAIVTSKGKVATKLTLEHLKINTFFDDVISLDDVKKPKPDKEGIEILLNRFAITNDQVLFVGDTIADYIASENANVDCAMVGWAIRGVPKDTNPKYILTSFEELKEVINHAK